MKKIFTLLSAVICLSVASEAASYPYDRPCDQQCVDQCVDVDPCMAQCYPSCGRFYVGAFGGANWLNIHKLHGVRLKSKVGFTGALSLGYKFDNNFRVEGEVSYRRNHLESKHLGYYSDSSDGYYSDSFDGYFSDSSERYYSGSYEGKKTCGSVHSWSYMANFLYDFEQCSCYLSNVVPYLGIGLGYTQNHAHLKEGHGYYRESTKAKGNGFAYQGIAGLGYRLTDSTILALEYRYFTGKDHIHDHNLGLALRQSF